MVGGDDRCWVWHLHSLFPEGDMGSDHRAEILELNALVLTQVWGAWLG